MASDQIHPLHSNPQAMFSEHEHDLNGFNTLFPNPADATYDQHWALDSTNSQSASVTQAWQPQAATSRQHALQPVNSQYAIQNQFYGQPYSNGSASYQQQAFAGHGNIHPFPESALDPSLVAASPPERSNFSHAMPTYSTAVPQTGTVAPSALQTVQPVKTSAQISATPTPIAASYQATQNAAAPSGNVNYAQQPVVAPVNLPLARPNFPKMPQSTVSGAFLLIDFDELSKSTNSKKLANFLSIGDMPQDISTNRTTIPSFQRRKSRNEIHKLAAGDEKLLDKIAKKPKKSKAVEIKVKRPPKVSGEVKEGPSESSSDSYSDSEYDSSSDDEAPEISPLPKVRPDRPIEAVKYDTMKAVWLPRRATVQATQIRTALMDFWEVVRTIRDRWKADSTTVKEAEEAKKDSELPLLRERVRAQREMLEMALTTAKEHGHPEVIRLLGEHVSFIFVMYQFLADRVRELDYKSSLPNLVIEFLSLTTSVTNETLEKTKMNKVLTLFAKRGDEETQARIKLILDNAGKISKSKSSPPAQQKPKEDKDKERDTKAKEAETKESATKVESLKRTATEAVAGVKRPRPNDANTLQPTKRVAASASPTKSLVESKASAAIAKRIPSGGAEKSTPASAIKQKIIPKPTTSLFSGLQSASKKTSANKPVSVQQKITPAAVPSEKKAPPASSAPPKSAFSFADTMANLLKPKEPEPITKPEEKQLQETDEERTKRLRKEERRKLRVHFKPDISLVSIRYFTHDPEEEMGHDASMVRDAGDVHGEGRMFKQHKDMMDDDDEEDLPSEESFRDWVLPSSINFDEVDIEERKRNYEPYGGGMLKPTCPEKEVQERREATILMVFYSHSSDIPSSPKEPSEEDTGPSKPPLSFGAPAEPTVSRAAPYMPSQPQPAAPVTQSAPANAADVTSLLSLLVPAAQQQPQQPQQPPQQPQANVLPSNGFESLEKLFGAVKVASQPVPTPQVAPVQPPQQNNLNAILASLQQFQTNQQQQQPQQPQQPQQAPQPVAAPWGSVQNTTPAIPNADQLIATLQQFGMPPLQNFNYGNVQAPKQAPGPYEDPERKRMRDAASEQSQGTHHKRRKWNDGDQGTKNPNPPKYVVPCRFWKEGKCKKGDDCTYLHT